MPKYEDINAFAEGVKESLIDFLPNQDTVNYTLSIQEVLKTNGIILTGITIQKENSNLSPTIYMDGYYKKWQAGEYFSLRSVLTEIANVYKNSLPPEGFDISDIKDFEKAKHKITRRLINYEKNTELLESIPFKQVQDLAIIYQIEVGNPVGGHESATVRLTDQMLEYYGVSMEELDVIAKENTSRIYPASITNLEDVMFREVKEFIKDTFHADDEKAREIFKSTYEIPDFPVMYVGNEMKLYGAIAILDEAVQDEVAQSFGERYVVIPSSVHDVLILPFHGDFDDFPLYEALISSVNQDCLKVEDRLSDKAYMVDAKNHVLILMECAEKYFKEQEKLQKESKEIQQETNTTMPKRHRLP